MIDQMRFVAYIYNRQLGKGCDVSRRKHEHPRGQMIHLRLDETIHRKLKIRVTHDCTTIQHLVADLISREVGESNKSNKTN